MSDWYERNHPDAPITDGQRRCFKVLEAWQQLYNIHPIGRTAVDGGFHPCGDGIMVNVRASLSTWDDDSMTRLVLAAHRHLVRVDVSATGGGALRIQLNPREPAGDLFIRHPDLGDLGVLCRLAESS